MAVDSKSYWCIKDILYFVSDHEKVSVREEFLDRNQHLSADPKAGAAMAAAPTSTQALRIKCGALSRGMQRER